ncbi:hypothetical protein K9B33_08365 [Sphingobium sp. 3R8]|uniref:hypothetical protein n=1 Tax=Sphingobium sp. 3R8 TaxID=2874921 RepID=UPI001CCC4C96|nr:hypothetical protein [Sphingobium sp. 3R8]MBZ9647554.1 hypothetical protein [Sphingobium sp. 3R8]
MTKQAGAGQHRHQSASVTFIVQQAWISHCYCMPFAAFFGGTFMPLMLMLSPLAVIAVSDCTRWHSVANAAKADGPRPCTRHRLPLM